jgi:hypothetical protein
MRRPVLLIMILIYGCTAKRTYHKDREVTFTNGKKTGQVSKVLNEASGLVASSANPGCLWTLNDSGNPAVVYLIDSAARVRLVVKLNTIKNRDWEDIALGDGPVAGRKYVYVGDIGDNLGIYRHKYIYRFQEPSLQDGEEQVITDVKTFVVELPDGARDCETLLINPSNNDLYLVSKREEQVHVYREQFPYQSDTLRPEKILTLPMTQIVAGSISPDGREVLLKDYDDVFYWKMSDEKSIPELLVKPPVTLSYDHEKQGEAIGWKNDGSGFYTLSESPDVALAYLRFYKRRK